MNGIDHYVFLASAVAGRRVSVHAAVKDDELACSDGQSIVVPHAVDANQWLAIVAQAALIAAGSLDAAVVRQLLGRPQLARRYLYLEMLRATRLLQHRLPWSFTQLAELRGISPLSDSASESLTIASGSTSLPDPPDYFGVVRPLLALRRAINDEGLTALTRKQQQGKMSWREVPEHDEDEETETSSILRLFQNPFSSGNPISDMLNQILGAGVSRGKRDNHPNQGGGAEMPVGRVERSLRRGISAVLAKLPFELPELDLTAATQALTYPEWDIHQQRYQPHWVFVAEVEPWRPDGVQDLHALLQPPPLQLRRQLASLGLDHEMHRRQNEGSDLDAGALIDCAIDLRAGHSPPTLNIYRASRRTRRDLAVAIVLDISGSTGEQNQAGDSIFRKQLQLAYQLGMTLNSLGDTLAMFGFHSWGRKLVRVVRLKGHEERWSSRVAERLGLLEPVGYTRIGTAIRHGSRLLQHDVRLPNRLLVLITDGIAYDQDYEHSYAEGDARKALQEAKAMGAACVCLSVGSGVETQMLAEVFGAANILAVDEVAQITGRIREVCRRALAAVSRRRLGAAGLAS
jgi:nitric oxide reductase NorD protein